MRSRIVAVLLVAGLGATACGSGADDTEGSESTGTGSSVDGTVAADSEFDAVMVPTADGGELDFNSLRGQDVLLWFWAPW